MHLIYRRLVPNSLRILLLGRFAPDKAVNYRLEMTKTNKDKGFAEKKIITINLIKHAYIITVYSN